MKKSFILSVILAIFTLSAAAQGASISVRAPGQVVQGNNFTVTFQVNNTESPVRNAPEIKGCTLLYGPALTTMFSTQIINGRQTSSETYQYTFTYRADKAGATRIPAIGINADGKALRTEARNLTILPPDKSAQARNNHGAGAPGTPAHSTGRTSSISPKDLIVTVTMSKKHIYEQEAVIATIKVYTKHPIVSFRATTLPSFDGFLSEELPVSDSEAKLENFRGDNYYSVVLKRCLLYPQKDGTLTINSGRYDVTLETYEEISNGFFITRRPIEQNITTSSNQVSVVVSPLPQPKPAGFNGAVGSNFSVKTSLEPSLLRTNEAATYTYSVTGTGNIKYLAAPDIDFGSNVEEYEPETSNNAKFNGSDLTGTYTATYTVVPQQIGEFNVPASQFVYFNPSTGKYVTIQVPGASRKVVKGSASASSVRQNAIGKQLDDILHIKSLSNAGLEHEHSFTVNSWLYLLCYLIVIAGIVTAAIVYRRQLKLNADITGRRTARAGRVAAKRLKSAKAAMNAHRNDEFYAAVSSAIWGYLGDKLGIPSSALTRDNISDKLNDYGVAPELVAQTIDLLDECEMARFTPEHSDTEVSELYDRAANIINAIDSTKPAKK